MVCRLTPQIQTDRVAAEISDPSPAGRGDGARKCAVYRTSVAERGRGITTSIIIHVILDNDVDDARKFTTDYVHVEKQVMRTPYSANVVSLVFRPGSHSATVFTARQLAMQL